MIEVRYDAEDANRLLGELRRRMSDLTPVMEAVGQVIVSGTQQRFIEQKDPTGRAWEPLKPATIARRRRGGSTGSPQILRDTGRLMNSISYKATSKQVSIFTNVEYAGAHQSGIPWRNLPARPFIGISPADNEAIVEILQGYIQANETLSWWERLVAGIKRLFTR